MLLIHRQKYTASCWFFCFIIFLKYFCLKKKYFCINAHKFKMMCFRDLSVAKQQHSAEILGSEDSKGHLMLHLGTPRVSSFQTDFFCCKTKYWCVCISWVYVFLQTFVQECFGSRWKVCLSSRKTKHTFPNKHCGQILAEDNTYRYKKSSAPKKASARGSADDKDQKNMRNAHNSFDDMLPWQRRNFSGSDWTIYHLERTTICKCWYSLYRLLPTVEFVAVGVICLHGVVKTFKRPLDYRH